MTQFYILIIAIVLPTGQVQVAHEFVPKCPTAEEIKAVVLPMKEKGEILAWGGTCSPMIPATEVKD